MNTIQTHRIASGDAVSGNSAPLPVEFAKNEVARARKHVAAITAHYAQQIEAAESWLRETERRLRVAMMVARRENPVVVGRAINPAPWLEPEAKPALWDWQKRITLDESRLHEDD